MHDMYGEIMSFADEEGAARDYILEHDHADPWSLLVLLGYPADEIASMALDGFEVADA